VLRVPDRLSSSGVRHARRGWGSIPAGATIAALAAAAALASAFGDTRFVLAHLDDWHDYYGAQQPSAREHQVERSLGFDVAAWGRLRRLVHEGDRYAVVAEVAEQHEVRNFAAYSLLPAIQVAEVPDANVVIYYALDPPPGSPCVRTGEQMCLVRLEES
jgi:hypothetical protein